MACIRQGENPAGGFITFFTICNINIKLPKRGGGEEAAAHICRVVSIDFFLLIVAIFSLLIAQSDHPLL